MCGIVGYTGDRQAAPILLEGLSKLEYRGYDSAGLAVRDGTGLAEVVKATGRLIHDDLVMSAAMAVFEEGDLPIGRAVPEWTPSAVFAPLKW